MLDAWEWLFPTNFQHALPNSSAAQPKNRFLAAYEKIETSSEAALHHPARERQGTHHDLLALSALKHRIQTALEWLMPTGLQMPVIPKVNRPSGGN